MEIKAMDVDTLGPAVGDTVAALQAKLVAKVEENLSGGVLQERSGALKASILASLSSDGTAFTATVASTGVAYAAIQEEGGSTAPHVIVPVKARALAFTGIVRRHTKHPGSTIPAHHYLAGPLEALRDEIATGLKAAVRSALGAA